MFVLPNRRSEARRISDPGRFHLEHPGAEFDQELRGVGAGEELGEVQDSEPRERTAHIFSGIGTPRSSRPPARIVRTASINRNRAELSSASSPRTSILL